MKAVQLPSSPSGSEAQSRPSSSIPGHTMLAGGGGGSSCASAGTAGMAPSAATIRATSRTRRETMDTAAPPRVRALYRASGHASSRSDAAVRSPYPSAKQEQRRVLDRLSGYRWLKAGDTLAYLGLGWLSWRFVDGEIHESHVLVAALLSGAWLVLTRLRMGHLLKTYFDVVSRLEVIVPAALGIALAAFALVRTELL